MLQSDAQRRAAEFGKRLRPRDEVGSRFEPRGESGPQLAETRRLDATVCKEPHAHVVAVAGSGKDPPVARAERSVVDNRQLWVSFGHGWRHLVVGAASHRVRLEWRGKTECFRYRGVGARREQREPRAHLALAGTRSKARSAHMTVFFDRAQHGHRRQQSGARIHRCVNEHRVEPQSRQAEKLTL